MTGAELIALFDPSTDDMRRLVANAHHDTDKSVRRLRDWEHARFERMDADWARTHEDRS